MPSSQTILGLVASFGQTFGLTELIVVVVVIAMVWKIYDRFFGG